MVSTSIKQRKHSRFEIVITERKDGRIKGFKLDNGLLFSSHAEFDVKDDSKSSVNIHVGKGLSLPFVFEDAKEYSSTLEEKTKELKKPDQGYHDSIKTWIASKISLLSI